MGAILVYTALDKKSLALLLNYDFLKYLAMNSATLFRARDYEVAHLEQLLEAVGGEAQTCTFFGSLQTHFCF